jgi:cytochrome c556
MGGREILLGLILAIVAYMVWLLWQLWQMRRTRPAPNPAVRRAREPTLMPHEAATDETGEMDETDAEFDQHLREQLRIRFSQHRPKASTAQDATGPSADENADASEGESWKNENPSSFAEQAFMDGVERELAQVQEEVDALRSALAALREDLMDLREEFRQENQAARVAQNASPLYGDAMQMAMLGHDALTIAERCGIARAEAELVVSLVKNKDARSLAGHKT